MVALIRVIATEPPVTLDPVAVIGWTLTSEIAAEPLVTPEPEAVRAITKPGVALPPVAPLPVAEMGFMSPRATLPPVWPVLVAVIWCVVPPLADVSAPRKVFMPEPLADVVNVLPPVLPEDTLSTVQRVTPSAVSTRSIMPLGGVQLP